MGDITGIILAGGKSTRIGTDKAFLKIGDTTMIEQVLTRFKAIFKEIIIVANEIEQFKSLVVNSVRNCAMAGSKNDISNRVKVVRDIIPLKGPLGGIYTGLVKSESFHNFVVACDMPFIKEDLVKHILGNINGYDAVIPYYNNKLEPLCAVYSKNCIKPIENELHDNNLKITEFLKFVRAGIISGTEVKAFDSDGISFVNINTPEDYERSKYERIQN